MMEGKEIKHSPCMSSEDIENIQAHYSQHDNVEIKYVCTTDLKASDTPVDIFYRADGTAHPTFGNRYFGIYFDYYRDAAMICGADIVEDMTFGMIENDVGELIYSRSHHDFNVCASGNYIDGGRLYIRSNVRSYPFIIRNGEMIYDELMDVVE
jgi:hypothetical protein